jgi:hypothetical protein
VIAGYRPWRDGRCAYNQLVASTPKPKREAPTRPKGVWTPEEMERNERAAKLRVAKDRARGISANLEDTVKLTRFANELAAAFRDARRA